MLSENEKKALAAIQGDIPLVKRPYRELARRIGMEESEFIAILADLAARGVIRRFGATLRHQKTGYLANAMTAWAVAEDRIDAVARVMVKSRRISHCYRRSPTPTWPYNLYTMIHVISRESCRQLAAQLAARTGVQRYALLFSQRELKKTSMTYFPDY